MRPAGRMQPFTSTPAARTKDTNLVILTAKIGKCGPHDNTYATYVALMWPSWDHQFDMPEMDYMALVGF